MKRVAILGGGPAGAFAAERLASAGIDTVVFDEKLAWEKPCGGGLTYKAYHTYPFLIENSTPHRVVTETILAAPRAKAGQPASEPAAADLLAHGSEPHAAGARRARRRAHREGARAGNQAHRHGLAAAHQRAASLEADFCVVATGARNPLRDVGTQLTARDTMSALGYYVPGDQAQIDIQFLPHLEGYIWVFPALRPSLGGHLRQGRARGGAAPAPGELHGAERHLAGRARRFTAICCRRWIPRRGRRIAWRAMAGWRWATPPAWWIPSPAKASITRCARPIWPPRRCSSELRQHRRQAASLPRACCGAISPPIWNSASRLAKRVFLGRFLFGSVPARMVQFTRRSSRFRGVMQDLFAGTQPYLGLKSRLMRNLNGSLLRNRHEHGARPSVPGKLQS